MARATTEKGVFLLPEGEIKDQRTYHIQVITTTFVLLTTIGLLNLYSAAQGTPAFATQARNLIITLSTFVIFGWVIPVRGLIAYAYPVYAIVCTMLAVVLALGRIAGGSQRWLSLGPIGFQPSEFAKLALVMVVATFFASNRLDRPYRIFDLWPVMLTAGVAFLLIFIQPDFGTAGICILITATQLLFVRIDIRSVMLTLVVSPLAGLAGWAFFLKPYQKLRVLNLINPNFDPQNTGYNSLQSLIAVGSGGLFGKGFMQGTQAQLKFLPARHTDFIFSVYAEEHGFWGGALLFLLYGTLVYLALDIAKEAKDTFSGLVAIGIAALIFWEYAINVAMVLGLFPVVGVPLPFFSYGSSMLMTLCIALGMLVAIHRNTYMRSRKDQPKGKFMVVEKG